MDHLLHAQGPTRIRQSSTDDKAKILPCEIENVFFRYIELLPAQNLTSTFLMTKAKLDIKCGTMNCDLPETPKQEYHSFFLYAEIHFLPKIVMQTHSSTSEKKNLSICLGILLLYSLLKPKFVLFTVAITLISQHLLDILKDGKSRKSSNTNADHHQRSRPH